MHAVVVGAKGKGIRPAVRPSRAVQKLADLQLADANRFAELATLSTHQIGVRMGPTTARYGYSFHLCIALRA